MPGRTLIQHTSAKPGQLGQPSRLARLKALRHVRASRRATEIFSRSFDPWRLHFSTARALSGSSSQPPTALSSSSPLPWLPLLLPSRLKSI